MTVHFQSPSKWRFHCNWLINKNLREASGVFQSPSKWRFHCNKNQKALSSVSLALSVS